MKLQFDAYHPDFSRVFGTNPSLETVSSGFRFLEGPVWHPVDRYLIFSDIMGNALYRWDRKDGTTFFRTNSFLANGNTLDRDGNLVTCEHGTSRVSRTLLIEGTASSYKVLAAEYKGKQLNSPNDIVVSSGGAVYFTDPPAGRLPKVGIPRKQELDMCGVYRIDPDTGAVSLISGELPFPNGLCLSSDESKLFVNDSKLACIRVFERNIPKTGRAAPAASAGFTDRGVWVELKGTGPGVADGMKIDSQEHVYCAGPGGLYLFSPGAELLGILKLPETAANFTWGDDDLCSLYLAATTTLYRLRVRVPGRRVF